MVMRGENSESRLLDVGLELGQEDSHICSLFLDLSILVKEINLCKVLFTWETWKEQ